jgi:hypothetical protein
MLIAVTLNPRRYVTCSGPLWVKNTSKKKRFTRQALLLLVLVSSSRFQGESIAVFTGPWIWGNSFQGLMNCSISSLLSICSNSASLSGLVYSKSLTVAVRYWMIAMRHRNLLGCLAGRIALSLIYRWMPAFKCAIVDAGAWSIMSAYHSHVLLLLSPFLFVSLSLSLSL